MFSSVFVLLPIHLSLSQLVIFRPIFPRNQQRQFHNYDRCSGALLLGDPNKKASLGDCLFLNDVLLVKLDYLTNKPFCIRYIKLTFETQSGKSEADKPVDKETSVAITNPLTKSERCVAATLTVSVKFRSSENTFKRHFEVNPLTCFDQCLKTAQNAKVTVDQSYPPTFD